MPVFSMATVLMGMMLFICFGFVSSVIITLRFPRTRGTTAKKLLAGWRWLLWFVPCLAISILGIVLIASQTSDNVLMQTHVKTVAQDRQGNAYIVLDGGQVMRCAVAAECVALPDNTTVTYRWERHDDQSLMRIVGKG